MSVKLDSCITVYEIALLAPTGSIEHYLKTYKLSIYPNNKRGAMDASGIRKQMVMMISLTMVLLATTRARNPPIALYSSTPSPYSSLPPLLSQNRVLHSMEMQAILETYGSF